jgi:hypothetical protein
MNKDLTLGAHQKLASEALRWLCLYGIVAHVKAHKGAKHAQQKRKRQQCPGREHIRDNKPVQPRKSAKENGSFYPHGGIGMAGGVGVFKILVYPFLGSGKKAALCGAEL